MKIRLIDIIRAKKEVVEGGFKITNVNMRTPLNLPKDHLQITGEINGDKIDFKNVNIEDASVYRIDDKMFITMEIERDSNGNFGYITTERKAF